jgi:transcriptional regulator with XRE-family HTH domain
MGKAGEALKQTLESHQISQNKLATVLGVDRPIVFRWFHGTTDPTAETVTLIVQALREISPEASRDFVKLYLGDLAEGDRSISMAEIKHLPPSNEVNVAALARLFSDTTNSYKYLFFISLLDILQRRQFEVLSSVSFQELIIEMLANAWYPHTYFKLSFGKQDKISEKLDSLAFEIPEPILKFTDTDKKLLRKAIASQNLKDIISSLRRYVPFRLIIPFLKEELTGVDAGKGNQLEIAMPRIASQNFEARKPLYQFDSDQYNDCTAIMIHPDWAAYLEKHYSIIRGWASWEWLSYIQKRNPSTPGILGKLFAPSRRNSLAKQTAYWNLVLKHTEIKCIYSERAIGSKFSLDHYLPWSFVAHDQLWNLIPTFPEINSSKSNDLPPEKFFQRFVQVQHLGLVTSRDQLTEKLWNTYVEVYVSDLGIAEETDLLNLDNLTHAYKGIIQPLISLAANQGFKTWNAK